MFEFHRTTFEDFNFIYLVSLLDAELAIRDGDDHTFYASYNKIDKMMHCVVAYENDNPIGCGAFRQVDINTVEIKRMYVIQDLRNKGIATKILAELEIWASELNYKICILETGKKQPEAIQLYFKSGYIIGPNYGPYVGVLNSVCYIKNLKTNKI